MDLQPHADAILAELLAGGSAIEPHRYRLEVEGHEVEVSVSVGHDEPFAEGAVVRVSVWSPGRGTSAGYAVGAGALGRSWGPGAAAEA